MNYRSLKGGLKQSTVLSGQLKAGSKLQADMDISYSADMGESYLIGDGLKLENGVLSVDTIDEALKDNTKPITSGGVYMELGNIAALLSNI